MSNLRRRESLLLALHKTDYEMESSKQVMGIISPICIVLASTLTGVVLINYLSGINIQSPYSVNIVHYLIDWYNVRDLRILYGIWGSIFVLLCIPVVIGFLINLRGDKFAKLAAPMLLLGIPIMFLSFLSVNVFVPAFPPITERTPVSAMPGIIHVNEGHLLWLNLSQSYSGFLVFGVGFGLIALAMVDSNLPKAIRGAGLASGIFGLTWIGKLSSETIAAICYPLALIGQVIFIFWIFSVGCVKLYESVSIKIKPGRFQRAMLIVSSLFIFVAIITGLITGLRDVSLDEMNVYLTRLLDLGTELGVFYTLLIIGFFSALFGITELKWFFDKNHKKEAMILTSISLTGIISLFSSSALMPVFYSLALTKKEGGLWIEFRFPTNQILYMTEIVLELVFWLVVIGLISIICLLPLAVGYLNYRKKVDSRKAILNEIIGVSGVLLTAYIISIGVKNIFQLVPLVGFMLVGVELIVLGISIENANDSVH